MKHRKYSTIIVWCSFICFLLLYILSKGKGIIEPEAPFFVGGMDRAEIYHTGFIFNFISFIFITSIFYYITATSNNLKINYYKGYYSLLTSLIPLGLLVSKAYHSQPLEQWEHLISGVCPAWIIYVALGILSMPSVLFVLSWLREQRETHLEKKIDSIILGKGFMVACFSMSIIGLCICVYSAFSLDIWNDEGFTLHAIEQDWMITLATGIEDVHPPLYLVLFKIIAESIQYLIPSIPFITSAKLAAILPHTILVILCMTVIRKKWGNYVAGLGALSMVCMPAIMYHSQELRLYSWSMLWVTCAWIFTHSICSKNRWRDWAGLIIFSILTAYTLYVACIAVGLLWLFLAVWCYQNDNLKKWLLAASLTFLGILPWLLFMLRMINAIEHGGYWMPPIDGFIFSDLMLSPTRDILISILLIIIATMAYVKWLKTKQIYLIHALLGMGLVYITVIILCGISCVSTPIITARIRYIVPMLASMWLGTLIICNDFPRLRILISLLVCFVSLSEARSFLYVSEQGRNGSETLSKFIEHNEPAEFIIPLYKTPQSRAVWYLRSPLIIGNKQYHLLSFHPKPNIIPEDENEAWKRTKQYAKNNKLPSCLLSLLHSYRQALHTTSSELTRSTINSTDIERWLKSEQKNVYCISFTDYRNEPDMETTKELLAKTNIRLNKSPALSCKLCSGTRTILLYKLELMTEQ